MIMTVLVYWISISNDSRYYIKYKKLNYLFSDYREINELSKSLRELRVELGDVSAQKCDLAKSEHDARIEVILNKIGLSYLSYLGPTML